ncbi:MAG: hypothetical protein ACFUZC_12065 [Chthoniobacteraceae bacterium]
MLNLHDIADRRLLAVIREQDDLRQRRYTIVKLDPPIQRGWRRFYVLGERAQKRPDHKTLEAILAVIGPEVIHHSPDFRRRSGRRRKLIEIDQPLKSIPFCEWSRKNYPDEWLRYFHAETRRRPKYAIQVWVFMQPALFELKVERNWQWYYREVDPAIETRLGELDRWLEQHLGWCRYLRLNGKKAQWKDKPGKMALMERQSRVEIERALNNFPEVDPAASVRRGPISFRETRRVSCTAENAPLCQTHRHRERLPRITKSIELSSYRIL